MNYRYRWACFNKFKFCSQHPSAVSTILSYTGLLSERNIYVICCVFVNYDPMLIEPVKGVEWYRGSSDITTGVNKLGLLDAKCHLNTSNDDRQ